jgi:hypothetical protein
MQLDIGSVLQRSFELYAKNWKTMLTLALVVTVPFALIEALLSHGPVSARLFFSLLLVLPKLLAGFIVSGMFVLLIADVRDGRQDRSVGDYLNGAMPRLLPLIITSFLATVGIVLGCILLVIPGIVLAVWWSVATPVVMLENLSGPAALGRSREIVRGNGMPVFIVGLIALILMGVVVAIVGTALAAVVGGSGTIPGVFLKSLTAVLVMPFSAALPVVMYYDLTEPDAAAMAAGEM